MAFPALTYPSSPPQIDPGFRVLYHYVNPSQQTFQVHTTSIGIYPAFKAAQVAALGLLHCVLEQYEQAGFCGKVFKDIDLVQKGLITRMGLDGSEMPLNEFEIQCVSMFHGFCGPDMGGQDEATTLGVGGYKSGSVNAVVKLPPRPETLTRPSTAQLPDKVMGVCCDTQRKGDPHWAQSRIPYFSKRDEGPFRGPADPPYLRHIGFSWRLQQPHEVPAPQIVISEPAVLIGEAMPQFPMDGENDHPRSNAPLPRGSRQGRKSSLASGEEPPQVDKKSKRSRHKRSKNLIGVEHVPDK